MINHLIEAALVALVIYLVRDEIRAYREDCAEADRWAKMMADWEVRQ